uniref:XPG N-terminal domain-containing protein n=1 Tax=viral metagenome TaxID=1070528 RepID=A0A6C0I074_9ZZZZ
MGVKHLNNYFLSNCSKKSIQKMNMEQCRNKTIVVDTSIYLYKFLADGAYMEQLYLFLATFTHYQIRPIFIFDGKSPPEKMALIRKRYNAKKEAESKYDDIQNKLTAFDKNGAEYLKACEELENLRKKMVRIRNEHIVQAKTLIKAFGLTYYDAPGESDQLCAYMVKMNKAWACLSEDMDMFLLNCPRVLRGISLMNQTWVLYDTSAILQDLHMSLHSLIDIVILSGTSDYTVGDIQTEKISLVNLLNIYKQEYYPVSNSYKINGFYEWYCEKYGEIVPTEKMDLLRAMFHIREDLFEPIAIDSVGTVAMKMADIQTIMKDHGFVFVRCCA